jgi:hypothetical protein
MGRICSDWLLQALLFQQASSQSTADREAFRCVKYLSINHLSCKDAKTVQNAGLTIGSMLP